MVVSWLELKHVSEIALTAYTDSDSTEEGIVNSNMSFLGAMGAMQIFKETIKYLYTKDKKGYIHK